MATVTGGSGADSLNGTSGDDKISSDGGNDILYGDDGDDLIIAGAGRDVVRAGPSRGTYDYKAPSVSVQFKSTDAAYRNTVGYYIKDENGNPTTGKILWADAKTASSSAPALPIGVDPSKVGYFIIANGAALNSGANTITNDASVTFALVGGVWKAHLDSNPTASSYLVGQGASVFFDKASLNADGFAHAKTLSDGSIGFEDLVNGGDKDFNDVVFKPTTVAASAGIIGGDQIWGGNQGGKGDGVKDTFVFRIGDDVQTINDFEKNIDKLNIHGYTAAQAQFVAIGNDTLIILSSTDAILLKNISVANAQNSANFIALSATVVGGAQAGVAQEDGASKATGKLVISTTDSSEAVFINIPTKVGTYGSFQLKADGNWTYTLNNGTAGVAGPVQSLKQGEVVHDKFTVMSINGTTDEVDISITGKNDVAVISGANASGSVTEDSGVVSGTLSISKTLSITDIDTGENQFSTAVSFAGATDSTGPGAAVQLGALTITAGGAWTYTVDNSKVQYLDTGSTHVENFKVTSLDGSASQIVTVTILGQNEVVVNNPPTISAPAAVNFAENSLAAVTDVDASDPDGDSEANGKLVYSLSGADAGFFSIGTDGVLKFNSAPDFENPLDGGKNNVYDVTVIVTDSKGASAQQAIAVTVNNINEAPIALSAEKSAFENDTVKFSVAELAKDPDAGDVLQLVSVSGGAGTLTKTASSFTFDPGTAYDHLAAGAKEDVIFSYQVKDNGGLTVNGSAKLTLTGVNDDASIAGLASGNVAEDGTLASSGKLTVTDVDDGESFAQASAQTSAYGSFGVDINGNWSYNLNNLSSAVQALAGGKTVVDHFTVLSKDGSASQDVAITIVGKNDAAVIGGNTGSLHEDVSQITGQLTIADPDAGENSFNAQAPLSGLYGSFSMDALGAWTYGLNNALASVQALGAGQVVHDTFSVSSIDGTSKVVDISIIGENDAPTALSAQKNALENDTVKFNVSELAADVDTGDQLHLVSVSGGAGVLTQSDGSFTFDPGTAYDHLAAGAKEDVIFSYQIKDDAGAVVNSTAKLTITGVNDVASFAGTTAATLIEDSNDPLLSVAVTSQVLDVDDGENKFDPAPVSSSASGDLGSNLGVLGSISLNGSGQWVYSIANSAVDYLNDGQSRIESFIVKSYDGSAQETLTFTIEGDSNQMPTIGGIASGSVTEDLALDGLGKLTDSKALTISDPDPGESKFSTVVSYDNASSTDSSGGDTSVQLGSFSITDTGTWSYSVDNNAVQYLGKDDSRVENFVVKSSDLSVSETVSVTIFGVNDDAEMTGDFAGSVQEDVKLKASGKIDVVDADAGESATQAKTSKGAYGTFQLDTNGSWTFDLNNSSLIVQALGAGKIAHQTLQVLSADGGTSQIVDVTITGTNDVATAKGVASGDVFEDGNPNASGKLTVTDIDTGESQFKAEVITDAYGTLTSTPLGSDTNWTYVLNNNASAVQALISGETHIQNYKIHSTDGSAIDINISIHGQDDAGFITGPSSFDVYENADGGPWSIFSSVVVHDPDLNQNQLIANYISDSYGDFYAYANGNWEFYLIGPAQEALRAGEVHTQTYTLQSVDGATYDIDILIHGVNDLAFIPGFKGSFSGNVFEDAVSTTSGTIYIEDADAGEAKFNTAPASIIYLGATGVVGSEAAAIGSLSITETGTWTYQLDNSKSQYLTGSESRVESFEVYSYDGTAHKTIKVSIFGQDEPNNPPLSSDPTKNAFENDSVFFSASDLGYDPDGGPVNIVFVSGGIFGATTSYTPTGFSFNPGTALDHLAAGKTQDINFVYQLIDDRGDTVFGNAKIHVTGVDDPGVYSQLSASAVEDSTDGSGNLIITGPGQVLLTDPDDGQSNKFVAQNVTSQYGELNFFSDGSYIYTASNSQLSIQSIGQGVTIQDKFVVQSSIDSSKATLSINILGVNDAPVAVNTTAEMAVGTTLTLSPYLLGSDIDVGDLLLVQSASIVSGGIGTISIVDGKLVYDNNDVLPPNGSEVVTIHYTLADNHGGSSNQGTLTITVLENFPAVITGNNTGLVVEDSAPISLSTTDTLQVYDDPAQAKFNPSAVSYDAGNSSDSTGKSLASQLGGLTITSSGVWTYTVNNSAVQYLGASDNRVEAFTVYTLDGTSKDVLVTIKGVNDAASISGNFTGSATEDSAAVLKATGSLSVSDVDANQDVFLAGDSIHPPIAVDFVSGSDHFVGGGPSVATALGTMTITAEGDWTYRLDNSYAQKLGAGDFRVESFKVYSIDGTASQVITNTVYGVNDIAVITGASSASLTEVAQVTSPSSPVQLTAVGQLSITDLDYNQSKFGSIVFDAASSSDESGNSHALPLGQLTIDSSGKWTYVVDNSLIQYLGDDKTRVEVFKVHSFDELTTQAVSISITGVSNPALITTPAVDVTEDLNVDSGLLKAHGNAGAITVYDPDGPAEQQLQFAILGGVGNYGSLTVNADGSYDYSVGNGAIAIQQLGALDTLSDNFVIHSVDGTAANFVVTIHGTNDIPTFSGVPFGSVTEDAGAVLTASDDLNISDVDLNESKFSTVVSPTPGALGGLTITTSGVWTYTVDNKDVQFLGAGKTHIDVFKVHSFDQSATQEVTITLYGQNDEATVWGSLEYDINTVSIFGTVTGVITDIKAIDPDAGESRFVQTMIQDAYGTFTLTPYAIGSGLEDKAQWSFFENQFAPEILSLAEGQIHDQSYTIHTVDGTAATVIIHIHGINDAPDAVDDDFDVNQGSTITGSVATNDSDVDGDLLTYSLLTAPLHFTSFFVFDSAGFFTYSNNGLDPSLTDSFTYRVTDIHGATSTATVNLTINPALYAADDYYTVSERNDEFNTGGTLVVSGSPFPTLLANDDDPNSLPLSANVYMLPTHGIITSFNPDGSFTYVANGNDEARSDSFTYQVYNGSNYATGTVHITITPVNDQAPTDAGESYDVAEGGTINVSAAAGLLANASDLDQDTLFVVVTTSVAHSAAVQYYDDGSFSYTHDGGEASVDSFKYYVTDGIHSTAEHTVTINIINANDAPVAVGDTLHFNDSGPTQTASLVGNDQDADGDLLTVTQATLDTITGYGAGPGGIDFELAPPGGNIAVYKITVPYPYNLLADGSQTGSFAFITITADGVTFVANNAFDYLPAGKSITFSGNYEISDGNGGVSNATYSIVIDGQDNKDVIRTSSGVLNGGNDNDVIIEDNITLIKPDISGGNGDDLFIGGGDVGKLNGALHGGAGNDTFNLSQQGGRYLVHGDSGADIVTYASATSAVILNQFNSGQETITANGSFFDDVETFIGSAQYDTLNLAGLKNSYTVYGLGGADTITGGDGDDNINGGDGDDIIYGGLGNNTIDGGKDADTITGGDGDDNINGGDGDDIIYGGLGNNTIDGGIGFDTLDYGSLTNRGIQAILNDGLGTVSQNITDGSFGSSYTDNVSHVEKIIGSINDDVINLATNFASTYAYTAIGGGGMDFITTGAGNDTIDGGSGNDSINGGEGADSMSGGTGDDTYYVDNVGDVVTEAAGEGIDLVKSSISYVLSGHLENLTGIGAAVLSLTGNDSSNIITANDAGNTLNGGSSGVDVLNGGAGNDTFMGRTIDSFLSYLTLNGGAGIDTANYSSADRAINVDLSEGTGTIKYQKTIFVGPPITNTDQVQSIEHVIGTGFNDTITGTSADASTSYTFEGGAGEDTLSGGNGSDILNGGDGDDTIHASSGFDSYDGGDGFDTLSYLALDNSVTGTDFWSIDANLMDGTINVIFNSLFGQIPWTQGVSAIEKIIGTAHQDSFILGASDITIEAGAGFDKVTYQNTTISAVMAVGSSDTVLVDWDGGAQHDSLKDVEHFVGDSEQDLIDLRGIGYAVFIEGGSGSDHLYGGDYNDTIDGGIGGDSMYGGAGNDIYFVQNNLGDAVFEAAGEGIDLVKTSVSYTLAVNVENMLALGTDSLVLTGNSASNTLTANDAGNTLDGGSSGVDVLNGGAGNDTFMGRTIDSFLSYLTLNGGAGIDTADYSSADRAINVDLSEGTGTIEYQQTIFGGPPITNTDQVQSIEHVIGTGFNDTITGTSADASTSYTFEGGAGEDTLSGGIGDDNIKGGSDDDTIHASSGNDSYDGGDGFDTLSYLALDNSVTGTDFWSIDANLMDGTINVIFNSLFGQIPWTQGVSAIEKIIGTAHQDSFILGASDITIEAGAGFDKVTYQNTTISAVMAVGSSDTILVDWGVGAHSDSLKDVEHLVGDSGQDLIDLRGIGYAVFIEGGSGGDHLYGGDYNDTIDGGIGGDSMYGGAGNDIYFVQDNLGDVVVEAAGEGIDLVKTSVSYTLAVNVENMLALGTAQLTLTGNSASNTLTANDAGNTLDGGSDGSDILNGGGGSDTFIGRTNGNFQVLTMNGGAGADTADYSAATRAITATLNNGSGNISHEFDFLGVPTTVADVVSSIEHVIGTQYDDTLTGASGDGSISYTLEGGAGQDTLTGGDGHDIINGGDGIDIIYGGLGNNTIDGGKDADTITSGDGIDTINGGDGDDIIYGGLGNNTIDGGIGFDTLDYGSLTNRGISAVLQDGKGIVTQYIADGGFGSPYTDNVLQIEKVIGSVNDDVINLSTLDSPTDAYTAIGGGGIDVITTGAGNDTIDGGLGDDTMRGGAGNDSLTGGAGADKFVFSLATGPNNESGVDSILDFNLSQGDKLQFKDVFDFDGNTVSNLVDLESLMTVTNVDATHADLSFSAPNAPALTIHLTTDQTINNFADLQAHLEVT